MSRMGSIVRTNSLRAIIWGVVVAIAAASLTFLTAGAARADYNDIDATTIEAKGADGFIPAYKPNEVNQPVDPNGSYYVALGDSVGAGLSMPLYLRLRANHPGLGYIQFAAGGEGTQGYVNGSNAWYERPAPDKSQRQILMAGDGREFAEPFTSQQAAAFSFIQNHNITLVSMSLGGNDTTATGGAHALWNYDATTDPQTGLPTTQSGLVRKRLTNLTRDLRTKVGANVPIVAPNQPTLTWRGLNDDIATAYKDGTGDKTYVADVATKFDSYDSTMTTYNGAPKIKREAGWCKFTRQCAKNPYQSDTHPSVRGYIIMADEMGQAALGSGYEKWNDRTTLTGVPSAVDVNSIWTKTAEGGGTEISWNDPLRDGGSPITGYQVFLQDPALTTGVYCGPSPMNETYRSCVLPNVSLPNNTTGTQRRIVVRAVNANGVGTLDPVLTPSGVVGLTSGAVNLTTTVGSGTATVTWPAPNWDGGMQITSYTATASAVSGTPHVVTCTTPNGNGRSCTFNGLTNGRAYNISVVSNNAAGTSGPGGVVRVTPTATPTPGVTAPGVPTNVGVTQSGTTANVTWALATTGGTPDSLQLQRCEAASVCADGGNWVNVSSTIAAGATSAQATGLTAGSPNWFRVKAVNTAGSSNWAVSTATIPSPITLANPTMSDRTAVLTYTLGSTGGVALTGNAVQQCAAVTVCGASSSSWVNSTATVDSANRRTTVTGLTNGQPYWFRSKVTNSVGDSAWTTTTASGTPSTLPSAPTNLTVGRGDGSASVSWQAGANGGSALVDHQVQSCQGVAVCDPSSSGWTGTTVNAPAVSTTVGNLTNGSQYWFRVRAHNTNGYSAWTVSSTGTTPATTPAAPTLGSVAATNGAADLNWTYNSNGGDALNDMNIQVCASVDVCSANAQAWTDVTPKPGLSATSVRVTGLANGTPYWFRMNVRNGLGVSSWAVSSQAAIPSTVPTAPSSVSATTANGGLLVNWSNDANDGGAAIDNWSIQVCDTSSSCSGNGWQDAFTSTDAGEFAGLNKSISNLTPGHNYLVRVGVHNKNGAAQTQSAQQQIVGGPASAPQADRSPVRGNASADVSWAPPAWDGASPVDGWVVQKCVVSTGCGNDNWTGAQIEGLLTSSSTSAHVVGLTNGEAVKFRVAAHTAYGNGEFLVTDAVTPLAPKVYLALGDGLASDYATTLAQQANPMVPGGVTLVQLSCSGETSDSLIAGGAKWQACLQGGNVDNRPQMSGSSNQLNAAKAYLAANKDQVAYISISIGGNDTAGQTANNLSTIVSQLKATANPGTKIVGQNFFNPTLAKWLTGPAGQTQATSSQQSSRWVNDWIDGKYVLAGTDASADIGTAFDSYVPTSQTTTWNGQTVPVAVARICSYTKSCEATPSPRLTDQGKVVMAQTVRAALGIRPN